MGGTEQAGGIRGRASLGSVRGSNAARRVANPLHFEYAARASSPLLNQLLPSRQTLNVILMDFLQCVSH